MGFVCLLLGITALVAISLVSFLPNIVYPPDLIAAGNIKATTALCYFTILSNFIAAIWLIVLAIYWFTHAAKLSFIINPAVQGAVTLYIFITGAIFFGILSWAASVKINAILLIIVSAHNHFIIPAFVTALWFLPLSRQRLSLKIIPFWLIIPFLYFVFSIVRGAFTGAYPYPFLNPQFLRATWGFLGGYFLLIIVFISFLFIFMGFAALLIYLRNKFVIERCSALFATSK